MSVFMMLQVEGDPSRLAEVMSDAGMWQAINARAIERIAQADELRRVVRRSGQSR